MAKRVRYEEPQKLTDENIRTLKLPNDAPAGAQVFYPDADMRGLFLVVGKHQKSWSARAEPKREMTGKRKKSHGKSKVIGHFPEMSTADARIAAAQFKKVVELGTALPVGEGLTLGRAWEAYRDVYAPAEKVRDSTLEFYRDCIVRRLGDWLDNSRHYCRWQISR